jgi:hypothetical protein
MGAVLAALILAGGIFGSVWLYSTQPPPRWQGFRVADTIVGAVEETTGDVVVCTIGSEPAGCVRLGSASLPITTKSPK